MAAYNMKRLGIAGLAILAVFLISSNIHAVIIDQNGDSTFIPDQEQERSTGEFLASDERIEKDTPEYAPEEVLVKFKEGAEPQEVLQKIDMEVKGIERIHSIEPVISNFKKEYELKRENDGWYWFKGKNYTEAGEIPDEEVFEEAYKQMSPAKKSLFRGYKIKLPEGISVEEAIDRLEDNPNVEYAEPNYLAETFYIPEDPLYIQQWAHQNTRAEEGWDMERGDPNVVIAIIDTGVDYNHEDLADNIWRDAQGFPGSDFVDIDRAAYHDAGYTLRSGEDYIVPDNDPFDFHGHGTHCAGIAGAVEGNGIGIAGVAHGCRIMPVRAGFSIIHPRHGRIGMFEYEDIAAAITYAADNGARVISMSFGGPDSNILNAAIDYAYLDKGVVLVAAAGNSGSDEKSYPAGNSNVIAVGASDMNDERSRWGFSSSNYGFWVDVFAPGTDILSTLPQKQYESWNGTSMACPYVAGISALILSRYPDFTNEEIRSILRAAADDIGPQGFDKYTACGRVNIASSLGIDEPCVAYISSPETGTELLKPEPMNIYGTAGGPSFNHYILEIGYIHIPDSWTTIATGTKPVIRGLLGKWDGALYDGEVIFRLKVINTSGKEFIFYSSMTIFRTLHDGWPQDFSFFEGPAALGDLNNDGLQDLVFSIFFNTMTALDHNGEVINGWPISTHDLPDGGGDATNAAIGNIDDNVETVEVVFGARYGLLYAVRGDGSLIDGWPPEGVSVGHELISEPMLIDLDGDGSDEVIAVFRLDEAGELFVWNGDGSLVDGWPQALPFGRGFSALAAGDFIDNDGKRPEIAILQFKGIQKQAEIVCAIFDRFGSVLAGWPFYLPQGEAIDWVPTSIAIADITGDGRSELIFRTSYLESNPTFFHKSIHALQHDATYAPGWPVNANSFFPSGTGELNLVSTGDLDNDGVPEVIATAQYGTPGTYRVVVFDASGLPRWSRELKGESASPPLIADVDGDSYSDVVVAAKGGVYALDRNSDIIIGWPKALPGFNVYSPSMGDVDGDGNLELLVGGGAETALYLYDLDGPADLETLQWATFSADSRRTACLKAHELNSGPFFDITITSINPSEAGYGDVITITGNGFGPEQGNGRVVFFNDVHAEIIEYWSETLIDCRVPAGAVSGPLYVEKDSKKSNNFYFTIAGATPPLISDINPIEAEPGDMVLITGQNFGVEQGNSYVTFHDNLRSDILDWEWHDTSIRCRVPLYATSGELYVTTEQGRSNGFSVTIVNTHVPLISINSPKEYYRYRTDTVDVEGTIASTASEIVFVRITLDGNIIEPPILDPAGNFSFQLTNLTEGDHKFTVMASDSEGNLNSRRITFTVDFLPRLTIDYPTDGASVSMAGFISRGTAEDLHLRYVKVDIHDFGSGNSTGYLDADYNPDTKEWNFQVLPEYITAGAQARLKVLANDGVNATVRVITVNVVDMTPLITYISPQRGESGRYLYIRGENFGSRDPSTKVEFSNGQVTKYGQIYYDYWYDTTIYCIIPDLEVGDYKVAVINDKGKSNSVDFKVISRPTITITRPENNTTLHDTGFYFYGYVEGDTEISEVSVYIYDYGQGYTVMNKPAYYNPSSRFWYFRVTSGHITAGERASLYVRCKNAEGDYSYWQTVTVNVISRPTVTITHPSTVTVPASGFTISGEARSSFSEVAEVRIYVYDYGRRNWSVQYKLAQYNPADKIYSFEVLESHMTQGERLRLYVRAKDKLGNWSGWVYRVVTAE